MSIGGGGSSGQSQTQLDPQVKQAWLDLEQRAVNTANQGAPQQQVAGLNSDQLAALNKLTSGTSVGAGAIGEAVGRADAVNGGAVPMINATGATSTGYNPATMTAAQVASGAGQIDPTKVSTVSTTGIPGIDKSAYSSLWNQSVTQPMLDAIELQRQRATAANTGNATAQGGEGAWNGARAGVSDALTNEEALQQAGQAVASTAIPALQTTTGLMEQDQDRALQGQTVNAGAENTVLSANAQAALTKALTDAGYIQQTGAANQDAANTAEQFGAGAANATSQFNAAAKNTAAAQNQNAYLEGQGVNLNSAALLGNLGTTQQQQYLTGANAALGAGTTEQQQAQAVMDAAFNNATSKQNLPLQQIESAFGIIPSTGSGSVTNSSGKSGNIGF